MEANFQLPTRVNPQSKMGRAQLTNDVSKSDVKNAPPIKAQSIRELLSSFVTNIKNMLSKAMCKVSMGPATVVPLGVKGLSQIKMSDSKGSQTVVPLDVNKEQSWIKMSDAKGSKKDVKSGEITDKTSSGIEVAKTDKSESTKAEIPSAFPDIPETPSASPEIRYEKIKGDIPSIISDIAYTVFKANVGVGHDAVLEIFRKDGINKLDTKIKDNAELKDKIKVGVEKALKEAGLASGKEGLDQVLVGLDQGEEGERIPALEIKTGHEWPYLRKQMLSKAIKAGKLDFRIKPEANKKDLTTGFTAIKTWLYPPEGSEKGFETEEIKAESSPSVAGSKDQEKYSPEGLEKGFESGEIIKNSIQDKNPSPVTGELKTGELGKKLGFKSLFRGGVVGSSADTTGRKLLGLARTFSQKPTDDLKTQITTLLFEYKEQVDNNAKIGSKDFQKLHNRLEVFEKHFSDITGKAPKKIQIELDQIETHFWHAMADLPMLGEESETTIDFDHLTPEDFSKVKLTDFKGLKTFMSAAKRGEDELKSQAFLHKYNQDVAPKLTQELDALEYLSIKLSYLNLNEGDCIDMNIKSSCRDTDYGSTYRVKDKITSGGLVAYTLIPLNKEGKEDEIKVPLMVFRGTAVGMDKLAKKEGHGYGMQADLDPTGIGKKLFEDNKGTIMKFVDSYTSEGRKVGVMGHSLGGALASRTLCESAFQKNIEVTTFQSPALDTETANKFNSDNASNVVHQVVSGDILVASGDKHVPGRVFNIKGGWNPQDNHLSTLGTKNVLEGKPSTRRGGKIKERSGGRIVEGARYYILSLFAGYAKV